MKSKKIISLAMAMVMSVCLFSTSAFATSTKSASTTTHFDPTEKSQSAQPYIIPENDPMEVGEVRVAGEFEDGTILYVELVEQSTSTNYGTRGFQTATQRYQFNTKNWLGQRELAYAVDSVCTWYNSGSDSYIDSTNNTFSIYDSDFNLYWDDSLGYATPGQHRSVLCVNSMDYGSVVYSFFATVNMMTNPPILTLSCGS